MTKRIVSTSLCWAAVSSCLALVSGQAWGQTLAPGQAPTRDEIRPALPSPPQEPNRPRIDPSRAFTTGSCPLADSDIKTTIREVRFTDQGGGPLPPELATLLAGIQTTPGEQSIRVVCDLRDQAIARIRQARYVAGVQIPQQRIDEGVLRLEVISGRIVEVRVRGDPGPYENLLKTRIEQIKQLSPLNEREAEHLLLLANDVPGLNVTLGLSPTGGRPGDLIGELTITYRPFSLIANVQNYNATYLGRETLYLRGEFFGLTGAGDRTFIGASTTFDFKKQRIVQLGHSMLLGTSGTRFSLTGTYAESRPDLKTIDLRTRSIIIEGELNQPLARSVSSSLNAAVGLEYASQRTRVYSGAISSALNLDRIAAAFARIDGDYRKLRFDGSQAASVAGSLELRQGLAILGATKTGALTASGYTPSRFEGSATATVARGEVHGQIGLGPIFELAASARGQWSNRPLLNYDEFAIGNLTIGRGYDPGSNSGDRALGGTVEARANFVLGRKARAQIFGFYDGVRLWNLDKGSTEARRYLASVGGGVRVTLYNSIRLDVTYAHPLDPPLLTGVNVRPPSDRVLLSLTTQLVPFGSNR